MINFKSALSSVIAVMLLAQAPVAFNQEAAATVELASVTRGNNRSMLRLPGTVISTQDAEISAELSGRLTWIAEVGQRVEKGAPLAVMDDHLLQLQLRNDWAEIERTTADIEYNQRQIKRLEKLAQQNNTAQSELDALRSGLEMLVQERRIGEVNRDRTVYDVGRSRVRAPFSGIVASREMSLGEFTSPGRTLLRLVDTQSLEVSVNGPLRVARFNQPGATVEVDDGQQQLQLNVRGAIPVGDARSHMMELRLSLEAGVWHIGQALTVELPDEAGNPVLNVPRDALVLRDNGAFVFTVSADNMAIKVPVQTGAGQGDTIAVKGNLKAGDPVVIRGAERLRDGQLIKTAPGKLACLPAGVPGQAC